MPITGGSPYLNQIQGHISEISLQHFTYPWNFNKVFGPSALKDIINWLVQNGFLIDFKHKWMCTQHEEPVKVRQI